MTFITDIYIYKQNTLGKLMIFLLEYSCINSEKKKYVEALELAGFI